MPTPPPPGASPALAVVVLGRVVGRAVEAALDEVGLSVREVGVLGHLERDPGLSITELARRSAVTVQTMHTLVGALVARRLVDRGTAGGRGRTARLSVTPDGRTLLGEARTALIAVDQRLFTDPGVDVAAALGLRFGPPDAPAPG